MADPTNAGAVTDGEQDARDNPLRELVAHLRSNRTGSPKSGNAPLLAR